MTDDGLSPAARARVVVVSGPSAVGKGTIVNALRHAHPNDVWVSVSATTRAARPGEVEGRHYLFVDDARFDELVATDGLLEWALVHRSSRYGTPRQPVVDALRRGAHVILEIELQGARQVRQTWPEARFVFIEPPSWEALVERLRGRGTESAEQQARRLETARVEMAAADEFDHVIINDELPVAVQELVDFLGLGRVPPPADSHDVHTTHVHKGQTL